MCGKVEIIPSELIFQKILVVRGYRVILDSDLAVFYGVSTRVLTQAVRRNIVRFPEDFLIQLSLQEVRHLKSQFVTSSSEHIENTEENFGINSSGHGGKRKLPFVFTEQGIAMLSAVLKSERAISVSIQIMRSFVKLREMLLSNDDLAKRLKKIEARTDEHAQLLMQIIKELQKPTPPKTRRIGFGSN